MEVSQPRCSAEVSQVWPFNTQDPESTFGQQQSRSQRSCQRLPRSTSVLTALKVMLEFTHAGNIIPVKSHNDFWRPSVEKGVVWLNRNKFFSVWTHFYNNDVTRTMRLCDCSVAENQEDTRFSATEGPGGDVQTPDFFPRIDKPHKVTFSVKLSCPLPLCQQWRANCHF